MQRRQHKLRGIAQRRTWHSTCRRNKLRGFAQRRRLKTRRFALGCLDTDKTHLLHTSPTPHIICPYSQIKLEKPDEEDGQTTEAEEESEHEVCPTNPCCLDTDNTSPIDPTFTSYSIRPYSQTDVELESDDGEEAGQQSADPGSSGARGPTRNPTFGDTSESGRPPHKHRTRGTTKKTQSDEVIDLVTSDDEDDKARQVNAKTKRDLQAARDQVARGQRTRQKPGVAAQLVADRKLEYRALRSMLGEFHHVKGDGSCWLYAILASLHYLEHADMHRECTPTPRDHTAATVLLQRLKVSAAPLLMSCTSNNPMQSLHQFVAGRSSYMAQNSG